MRSPTSSGGAAQCRPASHLWSATHTLGSTHEVSVPLATKKKKNSITSLGPLYRMHEYGG